MLSYHNDPAVKAKYIARVIAHREADELIRGTGWNGSHGCAVGCTLDKYDHSRYPVELGIPEWVAYLEDKIFEGLPAERAMSWPQQFLEVIPTGMTEAQWESVRHALALKRLLKLSEAQRAEIGDKWGVGAAIDQTIAYHKAPNESAQFAAWSAAESARFAAWSAAESAAWSARFAARSAAESARFAARSAAESARSAAWSARFAAESARSAAWSAQSAAESAAESARSAAWSAAWSAAESAAESARSAAWLEEADTFLVTVKEFTQN